MVTQVILRVLQRPWRGLFGGNRNAWILFLFPGPTLSHVSPKEPVSGAELLQQELGHQAVVEGVENFQREELRHTEVVEKAVLPDAETIKTEKDKFDLLKDVEGFKPSGTSFNQSINNKYFDYRAVVLNSNRIRFFVDS